MGPCTASSCCCQVHSVSWVPVRLPLLLSPSPHSAMCHFQVSSHCCWVPFCHRVAGRLRASPIAVCHFQVSSHSCWVPFCHRLLADYGVSHCCCQACNLPWAPVPPPHAAA
ncbi:unnamed protein product, partial [Staurois parvus]